MGIENNFVFKHDCFLKKLEAAVEIAEPEFARVVLPLQSFHKNGMGAAHGGVIFSLADLAFGAAANAGRQEGIVSMTSSIQYLRPGLAGPLVAEAKAVRIGSHVMVYQVDVYDGERSLIATASFTGYATSIRLPE